MSEREQVEKQLVHFASDFDQFSCCNLLARISRVTHIFISIVVDMSFLSLSHQALA